MILVFAIQYKRDILESMLHSSTHTFININTNKLNGQRHINNSRVKYFIVKLIKSLFTQLPYH